MEKLRRDYRIRQNSSSFHAFCPLADKKVNMIDHRNCSTSNKIHKVEVIFSDLRLEKNLETFNNGINDKFINLQNCFIIPEDESSQGKKVGYCSSRSRRVSKRTFPLWTAFNLVDSHLDSATEPFIDRASNAENERGNVRYIAKIRLMKGENA